MESVVNPREYNSLFGEDMLENCGCGGIVDRTGSSGIPNELRPSNDKSRMKLIWDVNPIKSTYLSMISSATDERINLRDVLFQDHTIEGEQGAKSGRMPDSDGNRKLRRGKLIILDHCTVVSIEFEDAVPNASNPKVAMGLHNKSNEANTAIESLSKTYSLGRPEALKNSLKCSEAKLIAVGVKYLDCKSQIKSEKVIRPSGGGEIILCAGAFESPRILLSSGLGGRGESSPEVLGSLKKTHLNANSAEAKGKGGVSVGNSRVGSVLPDSTAPSTAETLQKLPPVLPVTLRGLGRNLQDHTLLSIKCAGNWWATSRQVSALKEKMTHTTQADGKLKKSSHDPKSSHDLLTLGGLGAMGCILLSVSAAILYVYTGCNGTSKCTNTTTAQSPSLETDTLQDPMDLKAYTSSLLHHVNSMPVLSFIAVPILCSFFLFRMNRVRSKVSSIYPLNKFHGYLLLDAAGNILSKDSKEPPR